MNAIETIVMGEHDREPLRRVVERVRELIQIHRCDIVIAVNGSCIDVGKTYVSGAVASLLKEDGIQTETVSDMESGYFYDAIEELQRLKEEVEAAEGVLLINAQRVHCAMPETEMRNKMRAIDDKELRLRSRGLLQKVHLWLGIYRSDKPFHYEFPLADILIQNDGAKNKEQISFKDY